MICVIGRPLGRAVLTGRTGINEAKNQFLCRKNLSTKQIVYEEWGDPAKVLKMKTRELDADSLKANEVLVKWQAAPINPADLNQIQGVYPVKPPIPAVGGNEGCARVEGIGAGVTDLAIGDVVIPARSGLGTWSEYGIHSTVELYRIDAHLPSVVDGATLQVNPSTAYRMLRDFVKLSPGDCVVQNGANSAVGRYVIQICRNWNLKSINVVRNREKIGELKQELKELGADQVFTEEEFAKAARDLTDVRLGFNCVGGRSSLMLARTLAHGGCLVTYGGMSKQPVQAPTGPLIFNDISLRGFWMSKWYDIEANGTERRDMYSKLFEWMKAGKLKTPPLLERRFDENFVDAFASTEAGGKKQIFIF